MRAGDTPVRAAVASILLVLGGCGSSAARGLVEAVTGDDRTPARTLLAPDARLVTSLGPILGRDDVYAALDDLPPGGLPSGHHDVAQLVLPDAILFASGADSVSSLALFDAEGASEPPAALVDYVALWNEPEAAAREALLEAFAAGGRYVDPTVDTLGREAFAAHLTAFRAARPDTTFEVSGSFRRVGDGYHFAWTMETGGATLPGTDVVELDADGRVALVAGFF